MQLVHYWTRRNNFKILCLDFSIYKLSSAVFFVFLDRGCYSGFTMINIYGFKCPTEESHEYTHKVAMMIPNHAYNDTHWSIVQLGQGNDDFELLFLHISTFLICTKTHTCSNCCTLQISTFPYFEAVAHFNFNISPFANAITCPAQARQ